MAVICRKVYGHFPPHFTISPHPTPIHFPVYPPMISLCLPSQSAPRIITQCLFSLPSNLGLCSTTFSPLLHIPWFFFPFCTFHSSYYLVLAPVILNGLVLPRLAPCQFPVSMLFHWSYEILVRWSNIFFFLDQVFRSNVILSLRVRSYVTLLCYVTRSPTPSWDVSDSEWTVQIRGNHSRIFHDYCMLAIQIQCSCLLSYTH